MVPSRLSVLMIAIVLAIRVDVGAVASAPANVLFIAVDDLNDWIGCLKGHPQVRTPHIDAMAKQGVLFTQAHCPAPVCGPSRAAIMSGRWPSTTGVYSNNANYPKRLPDVESLPEFLRHQGYHVMGAGKLFHGDTQYPDGAFDEYAKGAPHPWPKEAILSSRQTPTYEWRVDDQVIVFPRNGMPADRTWKDSHTFDWGPMDLPDDRFRDAAVVQWCRERLTRSYDKPFFLGVGIHLPHQPLYAPKRFHDLYPPATTLLPPHVEGDLVDLSTSGRDYALIPTTSGTHASVVKFGQWHDAVSSYLATVTFVDHLLGGLMEELDHSQHAENTWIVFWSDHGWHLGEKEHWGKATGWFRATRVPLIIVPPNGLRPDGFQPGRRCDRTVNLLDLFPTIATIAGLSPSDELEGTSLLPLIRDPESDWKDHTVTTFGRGNHAITTNRWRYIQYFDGNAELYDRSKDPHEWKNVIDDPDCREIVSQLVQKVPEEPQWKHLVRYGRFKAVIPADGSPLLLFNHAVENHLEERTDESGRYPKIVEGIETWLQQHPTDVKRIVIPVPVSQ
ncbi:MAG: sulfatase [Planctomycetota bacterium]